MNSLKDGIKLMVKTLLYKLMFVFPIKKNKVVFSSFRGRQYNDNPKAVSDIIIQNPKVDVVWILDKSGSFYPNIKCVKEDSISAFYELATAKVWVDNCRKKRWIYKRRGQFYIQTWHGNIAGKKVEKDANLLDSYVSAAKKDSNMADVFISGSKWASNNYRDAFWYDGTIVECGNPRSDIFYQEQTTIKKRVLDFYKLKSDTHLVLYAPTFRNDKDLKCYSIDYCRLLEALREKYGGEWKALVRLHPNLSKYQNLINYNEYILNGLAFQEINELIIASDFLITDYSSCMFDAMEANKIVLLFATDADKYESERGHYFLLEELPFPLSTSNDQLIENIANFDIDEYIKKTNEFSLKCGICNDGNASQKVAEIVINNLET